MGLASARPENKRTVKTAIQKIVLKYRLIELNMAYLLSVSLVEFPWPLHLVNGVENTLFALVVFLFFLIYVIYLREICSFLWLLDGDYVWAIHTKLVIMFFP